MNEPNSKRNLFTALLIIALLLFNSSSAVRAGELDKTLKKLLQDQQAKHLAEKNKVSEASKEEILNNSPVLKKLFGRVQKNTAKKSSSKKNASKKAAEPAVPETIEDMVGAQSAVVLDSKTEKVLFSRNAFKKMAPASLTKIMTAVVVLEACDKLDKTVTIKHDIRVRSDGVALGLNAGDTTTLEDLLYMAMLYSANDACIAIAEEVGGSVADFAKIMNSKAKDIGAVNSNFVNPNGMPNNQHYSNAYDIAVISNYAMKNEKFARIVGTKNKTVHICGVKEVVKKNKKLKTVTKQLVKYDRTIKLSNRHKLLGKVEGVRGIKTGYTIAAGRCLATSYSEGGKDLIIIVLKGQDVVSDTMALLKYDKFPQGTSLVAARPDLKPEMPAAINATTGKLDNITLSTITRNN